MYQKLLDRFRGHGGQRLAPRRFPHSLPHVLVRFTTRCPLQRLFQFAGPGAEDRFQPDVHYYNMDATQPVGGKLLNATVLACAATVPAVLGVWLGYAPAGLRASFASYLIAVTHTDLPARGREQRLAATVLMLSLGATAGAAADMHAWAIMALAIAGASWQAWTEVGDNGLRLPSAMAVLAMLLSAGNVSPELALKAYSLAFAGGAVWQGLVQYVVARSNETPPTSLATEFASLFWTIAAARRFVATMAALGLAGGTIVVLLPMPHASWLLTAALRVMKPSRGHTHLRLRQRFAGTAAGAAASAGLLGWHIPAVLHIGILAITLTIMQLVGARRYAAWTFCLTVIALDLGLQPREVGWQIAIDRILLTIGGLALAFIFSVHLP
jgi:Fusaric acid resistance protein-like